MNPKLKMLVRNLRVPAAPRRLTAMLSIMAVISLLFSFAASAQPVLAVDYHPPGGVNGLFWGDLDYIKYDLDHPVATGVNSDSALYDYVDNGTLYVALVVDGNVNDNVFDAVPTTPYVKSAGWPAGGNRRPAFHLINSELASFEVTICGVLYEWNQGYARQVNAEGAEVAVKLSDYTQPTWVSNHITGTGSGTPPDGYVSSSSLVWNMNNYASPVVAPTETFSMGVNCAGTSACSVNDWKSPFIDTDTVTNTGGWPETITTTTPISYSVDFQWEWAMVYEWSVPLPATCLDGSSPDIHPVAAPYSHHSPAKNGPSDDPTPVTLIALTASQSAALLPVAGLLVGVSGIIVAPRRRRRRDRD